MLVLDSRFFLNPDPTLATLRNTVAHSKPSCQTGHKVWLIAQYVDARSALADTRLSKRLNAASSLVQRHQMDPARRGACVEPVIEDMLNSDPTAHTRLRRPVGGAFAAHRMRALRRVIASTADGLLDELSTCNRLVDVVQEYAYPLATRC